MLNLSDLNEAQRRAVTYGAEDPLLVLAGPGSGKTFTLTKRILYLTEEAGIPPEKILVLTFTRSAALDMQQRFLEQTEAKKRICTANPVHHLPYTVNFGTFHSAFYSILCQSHILKPERLLSEARKKELLIPLIKNYFLQKKESFTGSFHNEASELLSAFSFYKNTGDREKTFRGLAPVWRETFDSFFAQYEQKRRDCGGFDFDDMLLECLNLFRQDVKTLQYWQERFPYLLLDEFQDINPVQYKVIRLLGKTGHVFAVGDDDQSIYGFRGSEPACLKRFAEDFRAEQVLLDINYRSSPEIVKLSLLVISENRDRFRKQLRANTPNQTDGQRTEPTGKSDITLQPYRSPAAGEGVKVLYFTGRPEQTGYLSEQLKNIPPSQTCAVLFRTNVQMQRMASSLRRNGIPYTVKEKSRNIYEHFIVKDIIAYLSLAAGKKPEGKENTEKKENLLRIINKPLRYVSRETLAVKQDLSELIACYGRNPESCDRQSAIGEELRKLDRQLKRMEHMPLFAAIQYIRRVIGYEDYLRRLAEKKGQEWEEWREMLDWLTEEAASFLDVESWMTFQRDESSVSCGGSKISGGSDGYRALSEDSAGNCVQLMTVHASKGLEFDRVWIPDCNERMFPYGKMLDSETLEEERRIFYVAMTRAKKSLELLCLTGTKECPRQPSRFLSPIPPAFHQIHNCPDIRQRRPIPFRTPHHPQ